MRILGIAAAGLCISAGVWMGTLWPIHSVADDFTYYADVEGQEENGEPSSVQMPSHGPSLSVEGSDLGFTTTCHAQLSANDFGSYTLDVVAAIVRPTGEQIGWGHNYVTGKSSVSLTFSAFDPSPEDGNYRCVVDNYVYGQNIGQSLASLLVSVRWPTSLATTSDQYLYQGTQNYNREIHYEVRDQFNQPLKIDNLPVEETYELDTSQNSCGGQQPQTGSGPTNNVGQFKDNLYVTPGGLPNCPTNPGCTTRTTQRIKVSGFLTRTNEVVYACNSVSVTPQ